MLCSSDPEWAAGGVPVRPQVATVRLGLPRRGRKGKDLANTAILPVRRKAGPSRFTGPLPGGGPVVLAALLALGGAVGGAAAPARAQDAPAPAAAPVVSLDRLRFEFKCYFDVPEWRGKGEEVFLRKLAEQKAAYKAKNDPGVAGVEALMARGYWELKGVYESKNDPDAADAMAGQILVLESKDDPVVKEYRKKANDFVVVRSAAKAKQLEAAGQYEAARKAYAFVVGGDDRSMGQDAVSALVRIARKQGNWQAAMETNDLEEIGAMLDRVLGELRKDLGDSYDAALKGTGGFAVNRDLKDVEDEKARNAGSTQKLQVAWRDVAAALAGVKGAIDDTTGATFRLEPEAGAAGGGEGKLFPATGVSGKFKKNPFLWHRGTYTVRAYAPGSDLPFASLPGVVLGDAPAAVEFPNRAPAGMVWVPPLKAGGEALFVDRHEVTIAQVEAVAGGGEGDPLAEAARESRGFNGGDRHPAWFFRATALAAYEKATGKQVPTDAQWLHAAFGGRDSQSHPFPWGKESPDGTRAFTAEGRETPESVGGRTAGAAPCGAEDMAGNVAEWVRKDGQMWLLGGNYSMTGGKLAVFNDKIPLRDPMPGRAAYEAMSGAMQNSYLKYKFFEDGDAAEGYLVGLRTVVPVPAK